MAVKETPSQAFKKYYPVDVSELMSTIITPTEYFINNRFIVLLPTVYMPSYEAINPVKQIAVNCMTASVPGVNFSVVERRESGQTFKVPYDYTTQNLTLTFRCSTTLIERKYFEFWFSDIFNPVYRAYKYFKTSPGTGLRGYAQNFDIILLSSEGAANGARLPTEIMHVKIFDAFPVNLSPINVTYDSNDSIATFDVELAFLNYVASNRINLADLKDGTSSLAEQYAASLTGGSSEFIGPINFSGSGNTNFQFTLNDMLSNLGEFMVSSPAGIIGPSLTGMVSYFSDLAYDAISLVTSNFASGLAGAGYDLLNDLVGEDVTQLASVPINSALNDELNGLI